MLHLSQCLIKHQTTKAHGKCRSSSSTLHGGEWLASLSRPSSPCGFVVYSLYITKGLDGSHSNINSADSLSLPRIEPRVLENPARSLITVLIEPLESLTSINFSRKVAECH